MLYWGVRKQPVGFMKYTYLQYEYRGKWMHVSWCEKFFASDKEHFDRVRNTVFGLKPGTERQVYPEAAARLQERERVYSRRVVSLYTGLGLLDDHLNPQPPQPRT